MPTKLSSPHDKAFKASLSNKQVAKEFFDQHLPEAVKQVIDFESLTLCSDTYVDDELRLLASDIVYAVNIKNQPGYLYTLLEHQRNPDKLMPFRIIKYVLAIMDKHLKQHPKEQKLPLVIPLVFYQGKTPYPYSTDIKNLVAAPRDLIDLFLFQPFKLIESGQLSDEELRQRQLAGLVQLVFKHIDDNDILDWLPQSMQLVIQADKQGATNLLLTLIRYTLEAADTQQPQNVVKLLVDNLSQEVKENVMTVAERLQLIGFSQGEQQGFIKGKTEGEALMLKRLLQLKFGPISANYQTKIQQADAETLLVWSERVFTATTMREIFLADE